MERSARSTLNTQIYEEACEWFIEFRGGEIDGTQRRELDQWLRKSPEHLRAYLEIAAIWNEGPTLDPTNKWSMHTLVTQALDEPGNVLAHPGSSRVTEAPAHLAASKAGSRKKARYLMAIAASILVATMLGAWLYGERNVYSTGIGEQRSIRLADGSTVDLNSRSRIEVRYSDGQRTVDLLQGQALFQVAKEAGRPFIVKSDATSVRAVGTQFDVNRRRAGTVVTVLEGRVAVISDLPELAPVHVAATAMQDNAGTTTPSTGPRQAMRTRRATAEEPIYLSAGEQLAVTNNLEPQPVAANLASATAWRQRQLVFESATLTEVAEEFNRYNERQLVIEDAELYDFHISGVFSSSEPGALLRFLRSRPGVQVSEAGGEIRVSQKHSPQG